MIHVGDITKLHGWEPEPVDCITGGSPCQDLSLAGKRAGLAGERSSLFMEQVRLVKEMRDATRTSALSRGRIKPRYMVWENVAGAFSSNGGKDFQAVLTEIARIAEPEAPNVPMPEKTWPHAGCLYSEVGAWSIAWRLHDAQYWGVPQRRKRIALVADFGGLSAPEILFERKGLSGDFAESGDEGKGSAGKTSDSTGETSYGVTTKVLAFEPGIASREGGHCYEDKSGTLRAEPGDNQMAVAIENHPNDSRVKLSPDGKVQTLSGRMGTGGGNTPLVLESNHGGMAVVGVDCYNLAETGDVGRTLATAGGGLNEHIPVVLESNQNHATAKETEVCPALKAAGGEGGGTQTGPKVLAFEPDIQKVTGPLMANTHPGSYSGQDAYNDLLVTAHTLKAKANCQFRADAESYPVQDNIVRRLTPLECERLQGFPDGWTAIGAWTDSKGKIHKESSDSARYKALGNSIAVGYANRQSGFWMNLMKRISAQYEGSATLGSLFDGIGGFPLAWEFYNGKGSARWASEVEEFCIAVTKRRFPDGTPCGGKK